MMTNRPRLSRSVKWLTKSDYKKFLTHPAYLWLQKHDKDKLPAFDEQGQAIVDQGNEVEAYARKLYKDGVLVEAEIFDMADKTKEVVKDIKPGQTVFQAAVLTERRLYAAADMLTRNADGTWDLTEVKSSVASKPDHLNDLAFQKIAFEDAGYQIGKMSLIIINKHYERQGEIEPNKLVYTKDVTDEVEPLLKVTRKGIEEALKVVASPECPDDDPSYCSNWPAWREIYRRLHPELTEDSIYNLCRLDTKQIKQLAKLQVKTLGAVPAEFQLKPAQLDQLKAVKAGEVTKHQGKIAHALRKLKFPLYFFDYETIFPAIPQYDGTRPYQQVPFQYSLHILHEDGKLEHKEFLHQGGDNPMPHLVKQLAADIGPEGSLISWNKMFEAGVNDQLGAHYPEHKEFLKKLNRRTYDLMNIFTYGWYADAKFMGSASIKAVLPVIVPELSYKDLEIGEGGTASLRWLQTARGQIDGPAAEKVFEDLKVYCRQDTLAMVKIYQFLDKLSADVPEQTSLI